MVGNSKVKSSNGNDINEFEHDMKHSKNICPVSDNYYSKCPVMRRYYYLLEEFYASWSWSG